MPDFSFLKEYFDVAIAINIVVLLTAIVQITNTRFSKKYIGLKSFLVFILLALGAVEASTLFSFGLKGQEKSGIFYIIAAVLFSLFLTYGIIILRRVFREPGLNDKKRKRYTITFSLLFIVTALVPIFLDLLSITPYTNTLIVIAVIIEILTIGGYWAYRTKIKTVSNILRLSIIVIMLFNTFTIILLYFGFFDITKIALGVDSYLNLKLLLVVIKFILTLAFSLFIGIDFYRNKYKKHGLHGPTVVNITFYIIIVLAIMAFCFEVVYFTSNTEETLYKGIDTQNDLISKLTTFVQGFKKVGGNKM